MTARRVEDVGIHFQEPLDVRGNGRKTKVVCTSKTETLEVGRKRIIAVRVVYVFGNDATATTEVNV